MAESRPITIETAGGRADGPDEPRLIARVVRRDLAAFEALFRIYHPRLSRFLAGLGHSPAVVEEVLNDTMMTVWERADRFNGTSKVSTWIFGIAYRKGLSARRRKDEPVDDSHVAEQPSDDPDPEVVLGDNQAHGRLHRAIAGLSPDHRTVVDLTYFHGAGYREIAEIMSCPVDTVKTRMFHARRRLKQALSGRREDWL